ncbi:MAG: tannase/feruloyl esterase family alpha/beta hydrolase, partial [Cellvibrionaceae bacterium]|nr:tannase/feruloyl esterase family alpha/beta hydrolase [Cellvibrionaceae bacterium]
MLACGASGEAEKCLNSAQVAALKRLYAPIKDSSGKIIYGPLAYGSELEWKDWLMPSIPGVKPWHYYAATEFLKYLAYPNATPIGYNWRDFDYRKEKTKLAEMSTVYDADNPDLREFRDAGGKMIVIHGYADAAIPPYPTIDWYNDVSKFMGGYEKTADFSRLFLLPGLH